MRLGNITGTTRVVLGLTVAQLGRVAEGRALLEAACEHFDLTASNRSSVLAHNTLALVLLLDGDLEAAERTARAVGDDPQAGPHVQARSAAILTQVLLAQGRIEEALSASARAIELRGGRTGPDDDPIVLLARVEALLASGDLPRAKESLRTALHDIDARAAKIMDPKYRESFLRRAPVPARIRELAAELLAADRG
jgi:tetratricopeptide (TPR) repeat protein